MIEKSQVEHIARLARLSVSEQEKDTFSQQLSAILSYVEKLNELDTKDIEPTSHVLNLVNVTRKDSPAPCLTPDEALQNAPDKSRTFYRVPKIIE